MPGPLDGVRVLDLTTMVSGPLATMMLADQGADVIKIEPPQGELMRKVGVNNRGMTASFLCNNRGKRSLAVDIKSADGLGVVKKLAATADVLVQNFRPGAIERMGLGEDVVRALRPDIIFVSISGFGESGPYAQQRVYDPVIQALSGLADIQTDRTTGQPRMVRTVIPDKTTSVTAAQAITAALFARERGAGGQHVRLAMLDVMVAYLWPEGSSGLTFVGKEVDPTRGQLGLDLIFQTKDRHITAGAVTDAEWVGLCQALERPDLLDDPRFKTAGDRVRNVAARREITSAEIAKWPSEEILARLRDHDVPAAPILTRVELLDDAQVVENEIITLRDDPELGTVRQPRPAARFDQTPSDFRSTAPFLGADNESLLTEIGYSTEDVARLTDAGILHHRPPE